MEESTNLTSNTELGTNAIPNVMNATTAEYLGGIELVDAVLSVHPKERWIVKLGTTGESLLESTPNLLHRGIRR